MEPKLEKAKELIKAYPTCDGYVESMMNDPVVILVTTRTTKDELATYWYKCNHLINESK